MKNTNDESFDKPKSTYTNLPSSKNLPRVASLVRVPPSPTEKPKVDLSKITSDHLPRVASIQIAPRMSPRKKEVNLLSISTENLPRVATLQKSGSVSPSSFATRENKPRNRMDEATKAFEPALDRDMKLGTESPGPQMYSVVTSIIGNTNQINARIKATK